MTFWCRYLVFQLYPPIISSTLPMKFPHGALFLRIAPSFFLLHCDPLLLSFPVAVLLNAPLCHSFLGSLCGCFMLHMFTLVGHGLHLRYCGGAFSVGVLRYALSPFVLWFNQSNVLFFNSQSWIRIHGSIHAFHYFMLCLIVEYCQISLVTVPLRGHFPTVTDCRIFALFLFLEFHTEIVVAWMWNVLCRLMC